MQPGQRPLPKRFYREAASAPHEHGYVLTLDGRPARTPRKRPLALASSEAMAAIVAEWQAQESVIDPATMPVTRIVNSALDGVADMMDAVRDEIASYAGSDLVCYRAADPEPLIAAQQEAWDPVLAFARDELGALFVCVTGLTHVAQPEASLQRVRERLAGVNDPVVLAALHVMTTLTGSTLIALAVQAGQLSPEAAWNAAHVDELHQERFWGRDEEAATRRERRRTEFLAAAALVRCA